MYGVAISDPKVIKNFIAGGNKIYNPKTKPNVNVTYIIGMLEYKNNFSFRFSPGLINNMICKNTIGEAINTPVYIDTLIATEIYSVSSV